MQTVLLYSLHTQVGSAEQMTGLHYRCKAAWVKATVQLIVQSHRKANINGLYKTQAP